MENHRQDPPTNAHTQRRWASVLLGGSLGTLVCAIVVFVRGVLWTNGTYGSRMAWLLAGVLPLLLATIALAWTGSRRSQRSAAGSTPEDARRPSAARVLFAVSLALFALPFALALALLVVYAALFISHALSH
jgi:hypothetical protein